jgi:hypothetical protein
MDSFARGYARMAESVSRRLVAIVRPSYFGALERMSRQINEALHPRYVDSVSRLVEQMQQAVRPYLDQFAVLGRRLQQFASSWIGTAPGLSATGRRSMRIQTIRRR